MKTGEKETVGSDAAPFTIRKINQEMPDVGDDDKEIPDRGLDDNDDEEEDEEGDEENDEPPDPTIQKK